MFALLIDPFASVLFFPLFLLFRKFIIRQRFQSEIYPQSKLDAERKIASQARSHFNNVQASQMKEKDPNRCWAIKKVSETPVREIET